VLDRECNIFQFVILGLSISTSTLSPPLQPRSFQRESQALCLDPLVALAEAELRRRHKRRREGEAEREEEAKRRRERDERERKEHDLRKEEAARRRREEGPSKEHVLGYMQHLTDVAGLHRFRFQGALEGRAEWDGQVTDDRRIVFAVSEDEESVYNLLVDLLYFGNFKLDHAQKRVCFQVPLVDGCYTAASATWSMPILTEFHQELFDCDLYMRLPLLKMDQMETLLFRAGAEVRTGAPPPLYI
jgi:hypothetical protein